MVAYIRNQSATSANTSKPNNKTIRSQSGRKILSLNIVKEDDDQSWDVLFLSKYF